MLNHGIIQLMKTAKEWAELYDSDEFKTRNYYDGDDLGARCMVGNTTIKLWSPVADEVTHQLLQGRRAINQAVLDITHATWSTRRLGVAYL